VKEQYERADVQTVLLGNEDVIATSVDVGSGDFGSTEGNHVPGAWVTR